MKEPNWVSHKIGFCRACWQCSPTQRENAASFLRLIWNTLGSFVSGVRVLRMSPSLLKAVKDARSLGVCAEHCQQLLVKLCVEFNCNLLSTCETLILSVQYWGGKAGLVQRGNALSLFRDWTFENAKFLDFNIVHCEQLLAIKGPESTSLWLEMSVRWTFYWVPWHNKTQSNVNAGLLNKVPFHSFGNNFQQESFIGLCIVS